MSLTRDGFCFEVAKPHSLGGSRSWRNSRRNRSGSRSAVALLGQVRARAGLFGLRHVPALKGLYGEEGLAGREAALWLAAESLTVEHGGEALARYEAKVEPGTGRLRAVGSPRLFETSYRRDPPQRRLFGLDALGESSVPTTVKGYERLLRWAEGFGPVSCAGVEGTSSYGAGLTRHLRARGIEVLEVERPKHRRSSRRNLEKSDPSDAERAARAVLAGEASGVPKSGDGRVEMIRTLLLGFAHGG